MTDFRIILVTLALFSLLLIWIVYLQKHIDKLHGFYTKRFFELSDNIYNINKEIRYIYKKKNLLPYDIKNELDNFIGNENYSVIKDVSKE